VGKGDLVRYRQNHQGRFHCYAEIRRGETDLTAEPQTEAANRNEPTHGASSERGFVFRVTLWNPSVTADNFAEISWAPLSLVADGEYHLFDMGILELDAGRNLLMSVMDGSGLDTIYLDRLIFLPVAP
jgi:hypothetical protein